MTRVIEIKGQQINDPLQDLSIRDLKEMESLVGTHEKLCENHHGVCAICLNKIKLQ